MQRTWELVLSSSVLAVLASSWLGPCKVRQLSLCHQQGVDTDGIASISPERFPGASNWLILVLPVQGTSYNQMTTNQVP
jgi:hypothetical protein